MMIQRTLLSIGVALFAASAAQAESQSSNTSSNSSSNNGVVRERVIDTYCDDGYCTRSVHRRVYRDDWRSRRDRERSRLQRYRDRYERDDD